MAPVRWLNIAMVLADPIVLSTFSSLARHGYRMSVHCWQCERWVGIDLAALPLELSCDGRRFRCRFGERCGPTISKPLQISDWEAMQCARSGGPFLGQLAQTEIISAYER